MMLIIPIKPMILVLSLLSGVVLLGFIGSSLLDGKKLHQLPNLAM